MRFGNSWVLATGLVVSTLAMAQSHETYNPAEPLRTTFDAGAPLQVLGGALLDTRSGLVNFPGGGAGGADASRLQNSSLGMSTIGLNVSLAGPARLAEDFVVPASGWTINDITVYAYQTGSPTTSTLTEFNFQIWDGDPNLGTSSVVFGDTTTNRLSSTAFTNIFRDTETTVGDTNRPIMAATASGLSIDLPAGTYWIDWQLNGSLASGPWAPPLTTNGQTTTGNAQQFFGGVWGPANDGGTTTQQGFPLTVGGVTGGVPFVAPRELPVNSPMLLAGLLAGLAVFGLLVLKRRRA